MMKTFCAVWMSAMILAAPMLAHADDNEWADVTAEDLGISQQEFQMVKEHGMSRSKLMHLLEIGVSPNQYFSQPWKKLGVSESQWLDEKKGGMADDDINQNFHKQQANELTPFIAFFLPGYYHYQTHRLYLGLALSTVAAGSLALTFLDQSQTSSGSKSVKPIYPIMLLVTMVWSAGDAFIHTRYVDNQEAQRFSLNLNPLRDGAALDLGLRF